MNNTSQHNDDTITVYKYNRKYFIFDDPRDTAYYYVYYIPTMSFFHDSRTYYMACNNIQFHVLEGYDIPMDQWDRFIKRLSLLSASIQALVGHNIDANNNFIFPLPNQDKVVKILRQPNNDKFIALYILDKDDVLAIGHTQQYDPQTHEFIKQYFMELKNSMNHWLKLEQK